MKLFYSLLVFTLALPALAENLPLPPQAHIIVQGNGEIERLPDIIELELVISHTADNYAKAKTQVDAIVSKAIKVALENSITTDDINASKIQATPQYEWRDKEKIYKGERISRQLHLTLNNTERYNSLVDGLLKTGVTRLQQQRFSFSHRAQLEQLALQSALDDAQQQARNIASHMGLKLGSIYQIAPVGHTVFASRKQMQVADSSAAGTELKPGKQKIQQQIRVVYLLQASP